MSKTKTLKIAIVAAFSIAIATLMTQPAQAKFGLMGGYKYVGVASDLGYGAHVGQLDFLWTIRGGGKGYREGGRRPRQVFGFGLAVGGNSYTTDGIGEFLRSIPVLDSFGSSIIGYENIYGTVKVPTTSTYFALPLIYEYVFANGLGISGGVTLSTLSTSKTTRPPAMATISQSGGGAGVGFGISDLGLNYHFKNGMTLYGRANIGYASFFGVSGGDVGSSGGVMWGAGVGVGRWF